LLSSIVGPPAIVDTLILRCSERQKREPGMADKVNIVQVFRFGLIMVLLSVTALLSASPQLVYAEPTITEQQKYYEVIGQSLKEVNGQMLSETPVIIDGKKHIASCRYDIRWQFKFEFDSDWCMIKSVSVKAAITYNMPQWTGYSSASSEMQKEWDSFYARLTEHEEGHGKHAIETARDIEHEISILKRRSCQELEEAANETGFGLLKLLRALDADYDTKTKHGVLTNAILHEF
jgi:predicted secreted Zn-dependent protease